MKHFTAIVALLCFAVAAAQGALVNFSYTQTDSATGAGTIAAFTFNDGGGDIQFAATPLPAAVVVNPVPGQTPAGFVGAQTAQAGSANEADAAVGLTFSGSVQATGTRGSNSYTIQIPLVFAPKQTQTPDVNDYTWNVTYGDSPAAGIDTVSSSMRFAMWFSRDTVIDAAETPDTFQRYTQQEHTFVAGQDSFSNTDTTNSNIKDATDSGNPAGVDAAGRPLAFYWGWRDRGALTSGAVLVDNFTVGGLLIADEATLTLVPEPSAIGALALAGLLALARRRA